MRHLAPKDRGSSADQTNINLKPVETVPGAASSTAAKVAPEVSFSIVNIAGMERGGVAVGVVRRPIIVMPVEEKCCFVAGERGGEENSQPADICDSAFPLGAPWGGADAQKPLEENEAVIRSCPTGTNAASVTGAVILTLLPCSQLGISNQCFCAQVG